MKKTLDIYKSELAKVSTRQLYREWQKGSSSLNDTIRSWKKTYEAMEGTDISQLPNDEQKMWKSINEVQKRHQNWHFFRLESSTINGIPDVFGCIDGHSFWVELKASKVKNKGISKYQINWHLNHRKSGGKSYILNHHEPLNMLEILEVHEPRTNCPVWRGLETWKP